MIFGASGGIGHIAVQLAKRIGAKVLAIASGADGVALVRRLGADAAIDGRRQDAAEAARAFAPDGLDAALVVADGDGLARGADRRSSQAGASPTRTASSPNRAFRTGSNHTPTTAPPARTPSIV